MLTCRHCNRRLPVESFCRDRRAITGRRSSCRDCQKQRDQLRYIAVKRAREGAKG
jgi:hypothetical protein